jgi:hypothetical protein
MKFLRNSISGFLIAAAIVLLASAPGLQARPGAGGSFTLPFDARWGKANLPSGDYTFSVEELTFEGAVFIAQGSQTIAVVRPQEFNEREDQSKKPELICLRHDGKVTIRALRLPNVGTFYFALPKEVKDLVAQQSKSVESVTVEMTLQ